MIRKALVVAFLLATGGLALTPPTSADTLNRTNYITFSGPVRLPGVVLGSGSYIFELADPMSAWDIVRVLSRDRHQVYYTGFTKVIPRPRDLPRDRVVTLAESRADTPPPIQVWWPLGESIGREFNYGSR